MAEEKTILEPKIIGVYKELHLIANEINIKLGRDGLSEDSEYYYVDPDPDVTETITCSDCVCHSAEIKFEDRVDSCQIRFVLPKTMKLSEDLTVNVRRKK